MAGQTVSTLKFMITADASELVDGVILTKRELREVSKIIDSAKPAYESHAEKLHLVANAYAQGKIGHDEYRRGINAIRNEMVAANPLLNGLSTALKPANLAMTAAASAAAMMGAAIGGSLAIISERISAIDDLGDAAQRLGVSASSLSSLRSAAMLGDVDPGTADSLLQKMLVSIGKGSDAFQRLGLDADALKMEGPLESFRQISAAIGEIPTKAERMSVIKEIFGKAGPEAVNLIEHFAELNDLAASSGAIIPDELAAKVGKIDDSMKSIKLSAEGWKNTMMDLAAEDVGGFMDFVDIFMKKPSWSVETMFGGETLLSDWLSQWEGARQKVIDAGKADAAAAASPSGIDTESEPQIEKSRTKQLEIGGKLLDQAHERLILSNLLVGREEDIAEARAKYEAAKAGFDTDMQNELGAQARLLVLKEQQLRWEQDIAKTRSQQAIKDIDAAEAIKNAGKTPAELAQDRVDEAARLKGMSLLSEAEFVRESERAAAGIRGGGYGAPSAQQGTAAAREAALMAGKQDEQVKLSREMAKNLRKIAEKKAVPMEVVRDGR